ncbi:glycosyltransferase [Mycobacterium sp. WMMD1722]|uniref:glycosyltransferase n=1 Tax=Mycobacterium sp. WMMD1722 TaxID=3404117 RepID=UPI003BF5D6C8
MVQQSRVMVIGSGTRFVSGISHYTHALACALSERHRVSVVLIRRLLPRRLYPGADRVGAHISDHVYPPGVRVYDGVDWFWFPSLLVAVRMLWRERPDTVVMHWWTGAVAHTYLLLAAVARLRGSRIVLEMHELQDTGEAQIPLAAGYARAVMRLLTPMVDGFVIHSEADRGPLTDAHEVGSRPVQVIHHGPYEQYSAAPRHMLREAPADRVNLMFFGTIRPYKGLEDLVRVFNDLPEGNPFWLTVIGETWEGWTSPAELIAGSPFADRITFVNSYVSDAEAARWLAGADALVLPYRRSSASGPLHVGMSLGLPVAVSDIPALVDSAAGYRGCVFFPPGDVEALREALYRLARMRGSRNDDPASWDESVRRYEELFAQLEFHRDGDQSNSRVATSPR